MQKSFRSMFRKAEWKCKIREHILLEYIGKGNNYVINYVIC